MLRVQRSCPRAPGGTEERLAPAHHHVTASAHLHIRPGWLHPRVCILKTAGDLDAAKTPVLGEEEAPGWVAGFLAPEGEQEQCGRRPGVQPLEQQRAGLSLVSVAL